MKFYNKIIPAITISLTSLSIHATPIDIMNEYNLIVFEDLDSNSEVEGKTIVMGDINGTSSNYGIHLPVATAPEDSLIIGGNNNSTLNISSGYNVALGGLDNGTINLNGGGTINNISAYDLPGIKTELTDFSIFLRDLAGNSTLMTPVSCCGTASFDVNSSVGSDLAIFDFQANDFFENGFIQQYDVNFNSQTPSAIIMNVGGTVIDDTLFTANAVGNIVNDATRELIIWNFYEAVTIDLTKQLNGSLLAPLAALSNATPIEGSVVVNSFVQRGEIHDPTFNGFIDLGLDDEVIDDEVVDIPEPSSLAFFGMGLLSLSAWRRRQANKPVLR
ncbi:collagen-binding domain-containing protein [Photobacterium lutimaris]|uniref:Uncharacterized protein n=1 Tax=Photobacterium lutimaris TaxID=388278 RepID=A0A2T3IVJ1_9GAMM|nr:collagen-binding domain-containing protein [Photobacterium lutimaris]PSU32439.1 hypothetical protein C9I99_17720 [Photobacterium lutimaris]TDR77642.1 putative secreted protein with PEP-CTERM sorting signal/choice-of-anchor A domain-containing protein [Photobacterium lutimaris]